MKIFKQLIFVIALLVGFSVSVSAQKDGKKTPPKNPPPVIYIKPKEGEKPKEDKPKDEKKEKKPESYFLNSLVGIKILTS